MRKFFTFLLTWFCVSIHAQLKVGDNPTVIDPSAQLQIDASNKGLLIPRVALQSTTDGVTIATPATGLMVYSLSGLLPDGLYTNKGTAVSPNWISYSIDENKWVLDDAYEEVALSPVDVPHIAPYTQSYTPIGLQVTVTVPANSLVKVFVDYSTPIGFVFDGGTTNGYYGISFYRNGIEAPMGSRKFTVPYFLSGARMVTVAGIFTENLTNNTAFPYTITYSLYGYLETDSSVNSVVRFNMWDVDPNPNYNWGRGAIKAQVFKKKI